MPPNTFFRAQLEQLTTSELFDSLSTKDPRRAETIDPNNKRRLIRALEITSAFGSVPEIQQEEIYDALIIGIDISKEQLKHNIKVRLQDRIKAGMIDEVRHLHGNGLSYERLHELGIEYKYVTEYVKEKISQEEMIQLIETKSWQYAKRQMTWLKRNKEIVWVQLEDTVKVKNELHKFLQA